jgi:hypothetical protein
MKEFFQKEKDKLENDIEEGMGYLCDGRLI